ncbi:hypothetical protein GQ43DRAFT_429993 [Delitschia confertaspora ATCC 74209]|uniref:Uncharacterized protein n=1 Tax=Delitschia confertaspora ATCC 74209 TaxID=1513339 RepID=A0A9P4JU10_9PLEO|nr:hypothetical protein GQ43DRAFT_429993 [Delitschia confertaspora ATCC 74209]
MLEDSPKAAADMGSEIVILGACQPDLIQNDLSSSRVQPTVETAVPQVMTSHRYLRGAISGAAEPREARANSLINVGWCRDDAETHESFEKLQQLHVYGFELQYKSLDPLFAISIGAAAAFIRINREEKEAGRSTDQTMELLRRRIALAKGEIFGEKEA